MSTTHPNKPVNTVARDLAMPIFFIMILVGLMFLAITDDSGGQKKAEPKEAITVTDAAPAVSSAQYSQIADWTKEHTELRSIIVSSYRDKKITQREFNNILYDVMKLKKHRIKERIKHRGREAAAPHKQVIEQFVSEQ